MNKLWCVLLVMQSCFLSNGLFAKPSPIELPKQTPLSNYHFDEGRVIAVSLPSGKQVYNIFEIAMQAIGGVAYLERIANTPSGKGLKPDLPTKPSVDNVLGILNVAALNWLIDNKVKLKGGGITWHYSFDNAYNDVEINAPWGSAFGQAHVIKAFLHAYRVTKEKRYKDLSIEAAKGYLLTVKQNGFQSKLPDGSVFFEEVPSQPLSHILNGHMISVIALLELGKEFDVDWISQLAQAGVETLVTHLGDYDLGYWSRYDLNPKKGEIIFRLSPHKDYPHSVVKIDRVSLINSSNGYVTNLDVGASDDAVGAWRMSGIEWTQIESIDGRTVRGIQYGPAKHCLPVKGGSIQNSYLVLQLPELEYADLNKIPVFHLKIDYWEQLAGALNVEIQDISHGNFMGFRTLLQGTVYSRGSQSWKTAYVPVTGKDLAWFMGPDYQAYHVKLLNELNTLTGKNIFKNYAQRWQSYLDMHSEVNVEDSLTTRVDCN